jgi:hypothetical protein
MKKNNKFLLKKLSHLLVEKFKKFNFKSVKPNFKKDADSLISRLSKSEKYQLIIEKINQFNKEEQKINNQKATKNYKSILKKISYSEKYLKNISAIFKSKYKKLKKNKKTLRNKLSLMNINLNKISNLKFFETKVNLKKNKQNEKYRQKIGIFFYGDHNLIVLSAIIDFNNKINIVGVTEIPIPGSVIGDVLVEDINELANIAMDSLNLLELVNSPILVVLSSSLFNIHTFSISDLKQISETDSKVQSKSPFLPANTLVEFLRMSDSPISDGLLRAIYTKKDLINSWTDVLKVIDQPTIGLVPAAPHIFDAITSTILEPLTILIDIESTTTSLLIGRKSAQLKSYKLPFGYSLYISDSLQKTSLNYFERVLNSIKLILDEGDQKLPQKVFVMGLGLDKLVNEKCPLPKDFKNILDLKLANYSYSPQKMQVHELVSASINQSIYSLASILSSCV